MSSSRWINLAGAANVRDLGGLPTVDGRHTQPNRLIRSDNLQGLTDADVRVLLDDHEVRAVADLRTGVELDSEGPGPLTREPAVDVQHFSLFPEAGRNTDAGALDDDGPVVLPWQNRGTDLGEPDRVRLGAAGVYLRYLDERPDSVVGALRLIADTDGATIVHCAAGKDRTGVVVALALAEVGVAREAIVDDYAQSAERIEAIFARLKASRTYTGDLANQDIDKHSPRAATMEHLLDALEANFGGAPEWLRQHGWTDDDAAALRKHLLD
ncbi:MAG: protein-tyrosine phosphatase [Pseudonocardiales bacterium]|nr:protein-tyrosine phosphatase [Pseudonocardiales bacterium]MDT4973691.1 protein-tyrosine phosphatase [Pseudonocardiales bacterium]